MAKQPAMNETEKHLAFCYALETEMRCYQIAARLGRGKSTVERCLQQSMGGKSYRQRFPWQPSGEHHPYYKGGSVTAKGYRLITPPDWWEGATQANGRQAKEHQVVYCSAHGLTKLPHGFVVHHVNGIKSDNRPENLVAMTQHQHMVQHYGQQ